jgi:glycosyltransferase involved in cell wall biosynthesis
MNRPSMETSASRENAPREKYRCGRKFSVIAPVWNVEPYLDDFFTSLTGQSADFAESVEIICVDDGSEDATADIIRRRQAEHPNIRYFRKERGGRASARNFGLDRAAGEWVTFIDPDDFVDSRYFEEVDTFLGLRQSAKVGMICCRRLFYSEAHQSAQDTHYLRHQFLNGPQWIPASDPGEFVEASNSSVFYRRDILLNNGIRNKEDISPFFEDTEMNIFYITALQDAPENPLIGVLPSAVYYRRLRGNDFSFIDGMKNYPEFYDVVFDKGYIRTLETLRRRYGTVPAFAQRMVLTSLVAQAVFFAGTYGIRCYPRFSAAKDLHRRIEKTLSYCDADIAARSAGRETSDPLREFLGERYKNLPREHTWIDVQQYDPYKRQLKVSYTGVVEAVFFQGDKPVEAAFRKTRPRYFLDLVLEPEHIAWLALRDMTTPLRAEGLTPPGRFTLLGRACGEQVHPSEAVEVRHPPAEAHGRDGGQYGEPYRDCWLFIDSPLIADENAEHLYHFVRERHPEIPAWLVLDPRSPDWARLQKTGTSLLAYGSEEHNRALEHCANLISSNLESKAAADAYLSTRGQKAPYLFSLLCHGVMKSDFSSLCASLDVACFGVMTWGEWRSLAEDGSPYRYTAKEVILTGLPRMDALLRNPGKPERLVMVMPTWRGFLPVRLSHAAAFARKEQESITQSLYFRSWKTFFHSSALCGLLEEYGFRLLFWPHPRTRNYVPLYELPDYVEIPDFSIAPDIQDAFKRCSVYITDYSSAAFTVALLQRNVIYYQFDAAEHFSGRHNMELPSWFDYERDGFGPVCRSEAELLPALENTLRGNGAMEKHYRDRVNAAFPFQDTANCERAFAAIDSLRRA